jgi:DNA-binding XRE family transcriptional regulator
MERRNIVSRRGRPTNNWTPEECRNNIFSILRTTSLGIGLPNSIFNNIIGLKLRQKRLELKLTQSRVGSMLNVTFQQVQKYETGLNGISLNNLWKFCILNNVDINWFFQDIKDWETTNVIRKEE